jgi:hypothetical protein
MTPQERAAEKALLLLIKDDDPKTRYRLDFRQVALGQENVKLLFLTKISNAH